MFQARRNLINLKSRVEGLPKLLASLGMKLTTLQARIKKLGILGSVRFQVKSTFRHVPISSQGSSSRSFRNETETSETLLILTFLDLPYIDLFVAHALLRSLHHTKCAANEMKMTQPMRSSMLAVHRRSGSPEDGGRTMKRRRA